MDFFPRKFFYIGKISYLCTRIRQMTNSGDKDSENNRDTQPKKRERYDSVGTRQHSQDTEDDGLQQGNHQHCVEPQCERLESGAGETAVQSAFREQA